MGLLMFALYETELVFSSSVVADIATKKKLSMEQCGNASVARTKNILEF
jgi:hypothetical protein